MFEQKLHREASCCPPQNNSRWYTFDSQTTNFIDELYLGNWFIWQINFLYSFRPWVLSI